MNIAPQPLSTLALKISPYWRTFADLLEIPQEHIMSWHHRYNVLTNNSQGAAQELIDYVIQWKGEEEMWRKFLQAAQVMKYGAIAQWISKTERTATPATAKSPLAAAIKSTQVDTVCDFLTKDGFSYAQMLIWSSMNETGAWETFLCRRGLDREDGMQAYIASLKQQWNKDRLVNPAREILTSLMDNSPDFARLVLSDFLEELVQLKIEDVQVAVAKIKSWLEERRFKTQNTSDIKSFLRQWLKDICEDHEAESLISTLIREGVKTRADLAGFSQRDFRDCGFTITQANRAVATLTPK